MDEYPGASIVHERRRACDFPGHATGLLVFADRSCTIYDSTFVSKVLLSAVRAESLFADVNALHIFAVCSVGNEMLPTKRLRQNSNWRAERAPCQLAVGIGWRSASVEGAPGARELLERHGMGGGSALSVAIPQMRRHPLPSLRVAQWPEAILIYTGHAS